MLNIKKMVLFLIVGVFLIGMINVVFADTNNNLWEANITNIHGGCNNATTTCVIQDSWFSFNDAGSHASSGNHFAKSPYLRNSSVNNAPNGYLFNITIFNKNATSITQNRSITTINITLPNGLSFVSNSQNSSVSAAKFTYTNRVLLWNATTDVTLAKNGENVSVSFNATVNISADATASQITIGIFYNDTNTINVDNSLTFYLDGKLPTFSSAKTNDTTHLNLTFSENMNFTSIETTSFNVTFINRSSLAEPVAITAVNSLGGTIAANNATEFTLTIGVIEANETPTIWLNMSAVTRITDLAGYEIASNTSDEAEDGAPPTFKSGTIDLSSIGTNAVNVTLDFDEPMTATNINTIVNNKLILMANNTNSNVSVQNPIAVAVSSPNGTTLYVTLNFTDQSNVTRWRTGVNLTIHPWFFNDTNSNTMSSRAEKKLLTFTNDTTKPYLVNYTYKHSPTGNSTLQLGFSEAVDLPTIDFRQIVLSWNSNPNGSKIADHPENLTAAGGNGLYVTSTNRFGNAEQTGRKFYKTINLTFNSSFTDIIAWWDGKLLRDLYLSIFSNTSIYDLAGSGIDINHPTYTHKNASTTSVTWNKDETAPTVLTASISDVNITGPGIHRITIQFSENMTNSTQIEIKNTAYSNTVLSTVTNRTLFTILEGTTVAHLYYNFTQTDDNDEWNISISQAKDLSGNDISNGTTDLRFDYDSEPPYIIYSYYLENGTTDTAYNGTLNIGDTLVLVFNEPLQPMATINLSVGNLTFRDGDDMGDSQTLAHIRDNLVFITASGAAPALSLRGEWVDLINATNLQDITNRDLNANSSSWFIRDKADNFATNKSQTSATTTLQTGPKTVIADYAVEVTQNQAISISFPTCVNTGNMSDYLPSSTYYTFAKYYNTATWGGDLVTALVPLVGYRFTSENSNLFTHSTTSQWGAMSDNMLRIYLANQSDCDLEDNEITVDDGWNFLATDGNYYSSSKDADGRLSAKPDGWLFSLASAGTTDSIQVSYIQKGFGNYTKYSNPGTGGTHDWDNLVIKPYTGYWVGSTASNTFTGTGRN